MSEFEDYRAKRLETSAAEYCKTKSTSEHIVCPDCLSPAFLVLSDGIECLFCGTLCDFPDSNGESQ